MRPQSRETMSGELPIPNVRHGQRIILSVIDELAQQEPNSTWVSMPIDEGDLSKGYKEITYGQFSNAVNHAVQWLNKTLPPSSEPSQSFAYAGPKDLRYPILAVAAGKLGKVMVLPSSLVTPEAQLRILSLKNCKVYVRSQSMSTVVDEILRVEPSVRPIDAPELHELFCDTSAEPVLYEKSWDEGRDDPWLVFHTSGTTGYPKPITYTFRMMAIPDTAAGLRDIQETHIHQYAFKRWYTPLPTLHFVGMLMITSMSAFIRTVVVLGPSTLPPTPDVVRDIFKYGHPNGALLPPALIDQLCLDPSGLTALRSLDYIHYCGAPLGISTGAQLIPYVRVSPSIGSTEAGGYFVELRESAKDWQYISFQPFAGAQFERRLDNLYELVFVRRPEYAAMQQVFMAHPGESRYETNDLWVEHSERKGLWKIVGRTDDYVYLAHGEGLHASTLEREIERDQHVKAALIGGHSRPKPVLLIELIPDAQTKAESEAGRRALLESLQPYLDKVNAQCHPSVQLSQELTIFAKTNKPFERTAKGSVARVQSLQLYEDDIETIYTRYLA